MEHQCPWCDLFKVHNLNSMRIHCAKLHKRKSIELYRALFIKDEDPKCVCGCGQTPEFDTLQKGFNKFINGHNARVINSWGHNLVAKAKSNATRKKMFEIGELTTWCRGLSKETDERVAAYGRKGSQTIRKNLDEIQNRSLRMRKNRLNGTVQTLYGKNHSQWKGGTSGLVLCESCHDKEHKK